MTGTWSKVVKQIEHDGGPILPHTPAPPTPSELPASPTLGIGPIVARPDGMTGVTNRDGTIRVLRIGEQPLPGDLLPGGKVLLDGTLQPYPEDNLPTPAETLALADELTAAGTPDETFVGDVIRKALQAAADETAQYDVARIPTPVVWLQTPTFTVDEMLRSIDAVADRDTIAGRPTRIKLTAGQIESVPRLSDKPLQVGPGAAMFGYPVDLVDTVEESTPYLESVLEQPQLLTLTPTDMTPAEVEEFKAAFEQAYRGEGHRVEAVRAAESAARPSKANVRPVAFGQGAPPCTDCGSVDPCGMDCLDTPPPPPTVGFHEPPQPSWLARVTHRLFG